MLQLVQCLWHASLIQAGDEQTSRKDSCWNQIDSTRIDATTDADGSLSKSASAYMDRSDLWRMTCTQWV